LKVRTVDVVDLQWQLKETEVARPQNLIFNEATRNRILVMLVVVPDKKRVAVIIILSCIDNKKTA